MIYSEYNEQVKLFNWARHPSILKQYPELEFLYCNHNTQKLTKMQAIRWKSAGGKSGIPDIFLPISRNNYHGLFIEMKQPDLKPKTTKSKGGLSTSQLEFFPKLIAEGYKIEVCYSSVEAENAIISYINP